MDRSAVIAGIAIIAITILVSYFFPYYVSLPRSSSGEWAFFYVLSRALPIVITLFLLFLIHTQYQVKAIKIALVVLYGLYAVAFTYFAYTLYQDWSHDPAGQYFLPPKSDHYYNVLVRFGRPYIEAFFTGSVFALVFWFLQKSSKRKLLESMDLWLLFFIGSVLSFERTIIAIFIAFLSMIGMSLWYTFQKKPRRVTLFIPLMIGCWISMFCGDIIAFLLFNT